MTLVEFETWVKILGSAITAAGVIFASYKAILEWHRATEQRKEELAQRRREFRHRQATFARELVREIFSDAKARAALKMLDYAAAEYPDDEGTLHHVQLNDLKSALCRTTCSDPKELFIRTRFEALYDYLEQLQHLIGLEVINFDDVETTFRYFMVRAIDPGVRHFTFLDVFDYPRAKAFLIRFEDRKSPTLSQPSVE